MGSGVEGVRRRTEVHRLEGSPVSGRESRGRSMDVDPGRRSCG